MGYNFHIKCLVCLKCNKNLHGGEFIVMNTDDPYCQSCYEAVSSQSSQNSMQFHSIICIFRFHHDNLSRLKNAANVVKQSRLVFCALLERFIIQNVSNAPTVNAFWMEFLLLKIPKKELIALHAIKSKLHSGRRTQTRTRTYADTKPSTFFIGFIHQSALNVGNQSALNLVKRKHFVLSPWINLFTRHASFVR